MPNTSPNTSLWNMDALGHFRIGLVNFREQREPHVTQFHVACLFFPGDGNQWERGFWWDMSECKKENNTMKLYQLHLQYILY